MNLVANWSYPTSVIFGAGRIAELPQACNTAGITRPLLVTDRMLASMDITQRALDILAAAGLGRGVFSEVDPNPSDENVAAGLAAYREGGYDGVIAFGDDTPKELIEAGLEVPLELTLNMLAEKLTTGECVTRGWVLEDPEEGTAKRRDRWATFRTRARVHAPILGESARMLGEPRPTAR